MDYTTSEILSAGGLLAALLFVLEIGRRFGLRRRRGSRRVHAPSVGVVDGAIFPRVGLIRAEAFDQVLAELRQGKPLERIERASSSCRRNESVASSRAR